MADFNFQQKVAPVQDVDTDTSGGDGGKSEALAFGYNTSEANGGIAVGGEGGDGDGVGIGGRGGDSDAETYGGRGFFPWGDRDSDSDGGDGGDGVGLGYGGRGGDAEANGGDATTVGYTTADSSADGGRGGDADVTAVQNTSVRNDFEFEDSFNEDNDTTVVKNSFNQDNDGVDNSGGYIKDSVVAGDDIDDSFNSDDDTRIDDSFNTDNSRHHVEVSDDDNVYRTDIDDSFNRNDNDLLDLDLRADHLIRDIDVL